MLISFKILSKTLKINALSGSQQEKGRVGRIGNREGHDLYSTILGAPGRSLCDPSETWAATNIPDVQPYLWVAEGVLQVVQVVPCPPGLASCLQGYPVMGAFLKADIVVLRCAPPQSWLRSGFLRHTVWALHVSTLSHAQLPLWSLPRTTSWSSQRIASVLSSVPCFLSLSHQTTLTCSVPALPFSLALLLFLLLLESLWLSPPPDQRQWLQGLTIFIATFLCHMIPQCQVWSQQKALTLPGLNIRCG